MTIIANNCIGGSIYRDLKLPYQTPTASVQIFPTQFPKFCSNLKYYMEQELIQYPLVGFSEAYMKIRDDFFGKGNYLDKPYALLGDILLCFQHDNSFAEAKAKWDRRKTRIDYKHLGFLFYVRYDRYRESAEEFVRLQLPNSATLTQGFTVPNCYRVDVDEGRMFLDWKNGKHYYEQSFDKMKFINEVNDAT